MSQSNLESSASHILAAQITSDILLRIRSAGSPPLLDGASNRQIPCRSADRLHRPFLRRTCTSTLSTRTRESRTGRTDGLQLSIDPLIFVFPPSKTAPEKEERETEREAPLERTLREKNMEIAAVRSPSGQERNEETLKPGEPKAEERDDKKKWDGEERETNRISSTKRAYPWRMDGFSPLAARTLAF